MNTVCDLARAYQFAGAKHVHQRRKGAAGEPYVNHVLDVADLVAEATNGSDIDLIIAAVLHDTVEDTGTTKDEIVAIFGMDVANLVVEVTDDKSLPKAERKRLQIQHAAQSSTRAKIIKLADKIANLRSLNDSPPADWPRERIDAYVGWAERVVNECRAANEGLATLFDEAASRLRCRLAADTAS